MKMDVNWLLAVIDPRRLLLASTDAAGLKEPRRLAALVRGELALYQDPGETDIGAAAQMAARCLQAETITTGVAELEAFLEADGAEDIGLDVALTLILCASASELERYDECFRVLDRVLARLAEPSGTADWLARAVLEQQRALRLRDAGLGWEPTLDTALGAVSAGRDAARREPEGGSPPVAAMLAIIWEAVVSLAPRDPFGEPANERIPSRADWISGDLPRAISALEYSKSQACEDLVRANFNSAFGRGRRVIVAGSKPDIYFVLLQLELIGHASVYRVRRELALLRMVQRSDHEMDVADALRLLRHAGSPSELEKLIRRIRFGGPMIALSVDARQILATRRGHLQLRGVEMRVLEAASDLLSRPEVNVAFDLVSATLRSEGPASLPGHWQTRAARREGAWRAGARLAAQCGRADELATDFLKDCRETAASHGTAAVDDSDVARLLREIRWDNVQPDTKAMWRRFLTQSADNLRVARQVAGRAVGIAERDDSNASDLDRIIDRLNAVSNGGSDPALGLEATPVITAALAEIRRQAHGGVASFGSRPDVAEVGAALIGLTEAPLLWRDLTDFLLDSAVVRDHRSAALDRLARLRIELPPDVTSRFSGTWEQLLGSRPQLEFDAPFNPYPAGLRFLAAHGLMPADVVARCVAALAGSDLADARYEAARTLTVIARAGRAEGLLPVGMVLAFDEDAEVRAAAAGALVVQAASAGNYREVALELVRDLTAVDGVQAALRVLDALDDASDDVVADLRGSVAELSAEHPSGIVRERAQSLLDARPPSGKANASENER
jgi:hypothetical protein